MNLWFSEYHAPDVRHSMRVTRHLYSSKSDYQQIDIFDTPEFGKVLASASGTFDYTGYHTVEFEKPVSVNKFTVVVKTAGSAFFEGQSTDDYDAFTVYQKIPGHYEAKSQPGRSFIQIGEDWIDVTDPELMNRLGLDKLPPELQEEVAMPGDPCITVLFK